MQLKCNGGCAFLCRAAWFLILIFPIPFFSPKSSAQSPMISCSLKLCHLCPAQPRPIRPPIIEGGLRLGAPDCSSGQQIRRADDCQVGEAWSLRLAGAATGLVYPAKRGRVQTNRDLSLPESREIFRDETLLERFCGSVVEAVRSCGQVVDATDAIEPKTRSSRSTSRITSQALAPAPKKKAEPEPPKPELDKDDEDIRDGKIGKGRKGGLG